MRNASKWLVLGLLVLMFGASGVSVSVFAGEADDEEIQAEKERLAKEKKLADKKKAQEDLTIGAKKDNDPFAPFKKGDDDKPDSPTATKKPDDPKTTTPAKKDDPKTATPAKKEDPKTAKPAAPNPNKANAPGSIVLPDALPGLCPLCRGTQLLPNTPYKPYIKFESKPPPNPDYPAQWKYCDKCKPGIDPKVAAQEISDDIKARQESARDREKDVEEWVGKKLEMFETPFVVVRSMLKDSDNKEIARALEDCAGILQANSKTLVLLTTRPDTDQLFFIADQKTYEAYVDKRFDNGKGENKEMFKKSGGFEMSTNNHLRDHTSDMGKPGATAQNRAVFAWAKMTMQATTAHKAKAWLVEGFAAYCENATLKSNQNYTFEYEPNLNLKLNPKDWTGDVKKAVAKMKPWPEIFEMTLEHLKVENYLEFFSMVSFLIKTDPIKFDRFVLVIKEGEDVGPALEKTYGKTVADLQKEWAQWLMVQR